MASEPDPPWPREGARALARELLGWWRTLVAVTLAPRRFAAAWAAGESSPLNPLAYSLNTLAVAGPATALIVHLIGLEDDVLPLWAQLLKPLFPWVYNLLWLVPVHLGLRAMGGERRLRTTVGASFYAGGPLHIVRIFLVPVQLRQIAHPHDHRAALASLVGGFVVMLIFCGYGTAVMAGAHRISRLRAGAVVVFVFLVSVVLWGWFGLHAGLAGLRVVRALIT